MPLLPLEEALLTTFNKSDLDWNRNLPEVGGGAVDGGDSSDDEDKEGWGEKEEEEDDEDEDEDEDNDREGAESSAASRIEDVLGQVVEATADTIDALLTSGIAPSFNWCTR